MVYKHMLGFHIDVWEVPPSNLVTTSAYYLPENGKEWKKEKYKHIAQLYKNIFFMFLPYEIYFYFI